MSETIESRLREAKAFVTGCGHSYVTAGSIERELRVSMQEARQLLTMLMDTGIVAARTHAGYRVLTKTDTRSSAHDGGSTQLPASDLQVAQPTTIARASQRSAVQELGAAGAGSRPPSPVLRLLPLTEITEDSGVQIRIKLRPHVVRAYAEILKERPDGLPPPVVFNDGTANVLADGAHRVAAARQAGLEGLQCEIRGGTARDAALFAVHANVSHGLRLSRKEKELAAIRLLQDPEWRSWTDVEIAKACAVSSMTVGRLRKRDFNNEKVQIRKCRRADGSVRQMNVGQLGRKRRQSHASDAEAHVPSEAQAAAASDDSNETGVAGEPSNKAAESRIRAVMDAIDALFDTPKEIEKALQSDERLSRGLRDRSRTLAKLLRDGRPSREAETKAA